MIYLVLGIFAVGFLIAVGALLITLACLVGSSWESKP